MINHSAPFRSADHHKAGGRSRKFAPVALAVALGASMALGSGWPGARPAAAAVPTPGASDGGAGAVDAGATSIQYQQALEHQNDPDTFVPGDAVTVPYRPRAGDTTEVDGGLPVALPAGTASGRSMAASPQGSVWAVNDVATPTRRLGRQRGSVIRRRRPRARRFRRPTCCDERSTASCPTGSRSRDRRSTTTSSPPSPTSAWASSATGDLQKSGSGWAGWTSSWMTNVINNAHAHGTRVALTIEEFAWTTSEYQRAGLAPLERDQPRQRRRPDRRGRQPARRRRREPGLRADRVEPGRRLPDLRPDPPGRPGRHPPGLRAGLLRHRIHRLLRRCRPDGGWGGRRRVHHGL